MTKCIPAILMLVMAFASSAAESRDTAEDSGGKTVDVNGMSMYYETFGRGDPLLLLHGFSSSGRESWQIFREQLAEKYMLIIPDLRGHGRSTNPSKMFTHRQCAKDISALLDHLGIRGVRAAGISSGGMTLLHMATQQPERIQAMILIGATHQFTDENRRIQGQATVESLSQDTDMWGGYKEMRRIHLHGDEQIRELRRQFRAFKDNFDDMNLSGQDLKKIQAKTLIIHGDRDEFFPVEVPVEIYKAIPNSALWIVPNGSHVPITTSRFPPVASDKVPFVRTALGFFADK
ncbi:MAG: alpha/beta hydrolase [Rhodopirellula sp.]|nr:alpha/beta hydrolase [Rhodopirellula sp.]